jgi:hypothetical protein
VALILDIGPLYATLDGDDAAYRSCRKLVEEATEPLVIPALVLVEADTGSISDCIRASEWA